MADGVSHDDDTEPIPAVEVPAVEVPAARARGASGLWMTRAGWTLCWGAGALAALVVVANLLGGLVVVVVAGQVVEPTWATFVLGPTALAFGVAGWLLLRLPSRSWPLGWEVGTVVGLAGGAALTFVALEVDASAAFVLLLGVIPQSLLLSWSSFAVLAGLAAIIGVAVARDVRAGRRRGRNAYRRPGFWGAVRLALVPAVVLTAGAVVADDETYVLHRGPGGCAVVLRDEQFFFSGSATVFRAVTGSPVAVAVGSYPIEGARPFRSREYTLSFDGPDAHLVFDDGYGSPRVTIGACE